MATDKLTTRRETVRTLASCAVKARREGDRKTWQKARHEWEIRATAAEKRTAPAAITRPWEG
ncbi:MAG: hypothetical protein U9Q81_05065 [Pseudomonadota bacterium]|nr:hypothetical protein [Pseudomonadota bacterium]